MTITATMGIICTWLQLFLLRLRGCFVPPPRARSGVAPVQATRDGASPSGSDRLRVSLDVSARSLDAVIVGVGDHHARPQSRGRDAHETQPRAQFDARRASHEVGPRRELVHHKDAAAPHSPARGPSSAHPWLRDGERRDGVVQRQGVFADDIDGSGHGWCATARRAGSCCHDTRPRGVLGDGRRRVTKKMKCNNTMMHKTALWQNRSHRADDGL